MTIFILGTQEYATMWLQTAETDSALKKTQTKPIGSKHLGTTASVKEVISYLAVIFWWLEPNSES